ncbi:MAG: LytR family transcriptional regulator, partial [Actinomycetota bacterium]|nr:LytR family transcriptional regulator [Actinomycetota bacterium]
MSDSAASPTVPAPPRERVRGARWRRWLVRVAGALAVLVGLAAGAGILASRELNSNLTGERVDDQLDERPTPAPAVPDPAGGDGNGSRRPLNLLLIGSDTRAGANAEYGAGIAGARGDVTILLHLSADRRRAVAV